jgi:hypothetical protein
MIRSPARGSRRYPDDPAPARPGGGGLYAGYWTLAYEAIAD